jgi:hypothetical protein
MYYTSIIIINQITLRGDSVSKVALDRERRHRCTSCRRKPDHTPYAAKATYGNRLRYVPPELYQILLLPGKGSPTAAPVPDG